MWPQRLRLGGREMGKKTLGQRKEIKFYKNT